VPVSSILTHPSKPPSNIKKVGRKKRAKINKDTGGFPSIIK
jgi:hypothetical protein